MIDPHTRLIRALIARSENRATLRHGESEAWASVTFTGARHLLRLAMPAEMADAFAAELDAHEFAIPGHIVADIAVTARHKAATGTTLEIEALTIEDR